MKIIQFILIPSFLILVVMYFHWLRSRLLDRIIVLLFGISAAVMIAIPDLTVEIAKFLGVGRGTDLVLYLGLTGLSFACVLLFAKLREVEGLLTDVVRSEALTHAHIPKDENNKKA